MRDRLRGFDGLRAVAALTVVGYHVALFEGLTKHGPLAPLLAELKAGVGIFFVISGALLYLPFARAIRDHASPPDWHIYATRRAVRILPAYWLALTVFLIGPFGATLAAPDAWRFYLLGEIYSPNTLMQGLGVAWSLCVEVTFYIALPLFAVAMLRVTRRRDAAGTVRAQLVVLGLLAAFTVAVRAVAAGSLTGPVPHPSATLVISLAGFLDWFAIGMALAVVAAELEAGRMAAGRLAALAARPAHCVIGAVALLLAGVPLQAGDWFLPLYGLATHLAIGVASGLLVLAVIVPRSEASRESKCMTVLCGRSLTWLGMISYGIYLWHVPLLRLMVGGRHAVDLPRMALGRGIATALVALGGAIALGAASWYLLERPLQRFVRLREQRGPDVSPPTPPTQLAPAWTP